VRSVLWWGRFDPGYSRNRNLRKLFARLGWRITDFHPRHSGLADWQAHLRRLPAPDLVWAPCFRQRDIRAASRWAARHGVPLAIDPLISAYDKQVDERRKLAAESRRAKRLLAWERDLFKRADLVVADTPAHADYFSRTLGVSPDRIQVIYVGADDALFRPVPPRASEAGPVEVLFYGSFIPLQGPETVVEAARLYTGPAARWVMLGDGPLRPACEQAARGLDNLAFENWLPYEELPARIHQADILLGVFGTTPKADRVIPNKVFQALASGRPVVTRAASAYPDELSRSDDSGLIWVAAGDSQQLADQVARLAADRSARHRLGVAAAATIERYFAAPRIEQQLARALAQLGL
jgi:glycosyltransferase involved in cell wall biosynthesis